MKTRTSITQRATELFCDMMSRKFLMHLESRLEFYVIFILILKGKLILTPEIFHLIMWKDFVSASYAGIISYEKVKLSASINK